MIIPRNQIARPLRLAVLAMAPGSLCVGTVANAETRAGVDISAGGSVETSPLLTGGTGTDVAGSLEVGSWLSLANGLSSVNMRADLSLRQYSQSQNGTDISGTLTLAGSHKLSPYVNLSGGINYATSRNGLNLGFINVSPNNPVPPPNTPLPDISLGGTRTRTHMISANAGLSAQLSALDQIGASVSASRSITNSTDGRDFNSLNGGLNYSRTLNERLSLTASVSLGRSDYLHTRFGDGTIITPQIGFSTILSEALTLSVNLGASFSRSKLVPSGTYSSTALSGEARLCRRRGDEGVCLVAARSAQPTAAGSIGTITSISVSYDRRISRRDSVTAGLALNINRNPLTITNAETGKYYNVAATWNHSFDPRFSVYVSPAYSRFSNSLRSIDNFRFAAGVRLSFGPRS